MQSEISTITNAIKYLTDPEQLARKKENPLLEQKQRNSDKEINYLYAKIKSSFKNRISWVDLELLLVNRWTGRQMDHKLNIGATYLYY